MPNIFNMIRNSTKWAKQTNVAKDIEQTSTESSTADQGYQTVQTDILGQPKNVKNLTPYGLYNSPPVGSELTVFSVRGNSDDLCGIANDYKGRFKGLKEGEVALVNLLTGSYVRLKENGDIEVNSDSNVNFICPKVTFSGDVDIDGILTYGNVEANTHDHGGVESGTSRTDGPE